MATRSKYDILRVSKLALAVSLAFNGAAQAGLPTGAQVASGSAQIGTVGNTMTVTNSPSAIINWQSFSIGQSEAVKFVQQSASSSVLNRVVGGQMSAIMGRLSSNGQVFLINPAGVLVGAGAVIDTASFFASTLQILDKDFLAGKLQFQGDADSGKITNQGLIRTGYGGQVVLMAPNIENSGIIQAPGGKILLAAGQKVTLGSLDMDGLSFQVQAPTDSALNLGQLIADGGVVQVFAGSLKHSGDIRANALTRDSAGEIVLKARGDVELAASSTTRANGRTGGTIRIESESGTARVAGDVSATGRTGAGGGIDVLGEKVVLTGNTTLDASGATAGGVIRAGGDWQGANPDVKNAQSAFVGSGVTLKADATDRGDGGKIVVWSDGDTRFLGSLSAQGGPNGGNGGNAEVSGKGDLLFIGGANLGAPKGTAGSLLLDPLDLFVDNVGGLNPSIIDETTDFPSNAVTVAPATLAAIVGNVTLYASRDMRFNSAIALAGAGQGLAANAGRDLQIGAGITTNGGAVSLTATRNLSAFSASPIVTSGGNVTLTAQSISANSMTVAAGTGAVNATSSAGSLQMGQVISSGSVDMRSTGGNLSTSNVTASGAVKLSSTGGDMTGGALTSSGLMDLDSSGSMTVASVVTNGGMLDATSTNQLRINGSVTTGGGAVTLRSTSANVRTTGTVNTDAGGILAGGAVSMTAATEVRTADISAGNNASVTLSGNTRVRAGTLTTAGAGSAVTLTASAGDISSATVNGDAGSTAILTAGAGNISATVNGGASLTASATRDVSSSSSNSVNITSNSGTELNATSVTSTMTGANCFSSVTCSASVTLTASNGVKVNVGTVRAVAPTRTYQDSNTDTLSSKSESITIDGGAGGIFAASSSSLVSAADVTLRTDTGSGAGIGSAATPLKVAVERRFDFRPNGPFSVQLQGAGPNRLDMTIGALNAGSYTGSTLTGAGINVNADADTSKVTLNTMSITSGFDAKVYQSNPSISLYVPNGALEASSILIPQGDVTGVTRHYQVNSGYPYYNISYVPYQEYATLPASFSAANNLTVTNFTRASSAQSRPQNTDFSSYNGSVLLTTANANKDYVSVYADTGVTIATSLTTQGSIDLYTSTGGVTIGGAVNAGGYVTVNADSGDVSIPGSVTANGAANLYAYSGNVSVPGTVTSSNGSATIYASGGVAVAGGVAGQYGVDITADSGDVTLNSVAAASGSVTISANGPTSVVGAAQDGIAPEVTAAGNVSITAHTIGADTIGGNPASFPLDIAASSVSLTTFGAGSTIGFAGRPVVASTAGLTINASGNFNVSTDAVVPVNLVNLSVTASPSAVGNNGLAQVTSNSTLYNFQSDGTDFTLGGTNIAGGSPLPANQLAGGGLNFTASTGSVNLASINFGASGANLTVSTSDAGSGNVTQTGATIALGSGSLSFHAQGAVAVRDINAGSLSVETYQAGTGTFTQAVGTTVSLGSGSMTVNASGDVNLQNINAGSLSVTANQPGVGNVTQGVGSTIQLGTGTLSISADGDVKVERVNAGGMDVREANSNYYADGCFAYGGCGVASFTANQPLTDTANADGTWSVNSRGSIITGNVAVGSVDFRTFGFDQSNPLHEGKIVTGMLDAGSVTLRAGNDYYYSTGNYTSPVSITTGPIGSLRRPSSVDIVSGNDGYYNPVRGTVQTGAIEAGSVSIRTVGGDIRILGGIGAGTPSDSVSLRSEISYWGGGPIGGIPPTVQVSGVITASTSIDLYSYYSGPITTTGALRSGNRIEIQGGPLTVGGAIGLDTTGPNSVNQIFRVSSSGDIVIAGDVTLGQGGTSLSSPTSNSMYMHAGQELKINGGAGSFLAADGSFVSLQTGNTDTNFPFQFATIYAGPTGGVRVSTEAGIEQTALSASGGGITGGRIVLNADAANSAIVGPAGAALTLREMSDLTVTTGGSVKLDRTDGVNPIPLLTNVDISQSDSTKSFTLTGYTSGSTQSVTVTPGGGGAVVATTTDDGAPMNFRFQNSGGANTTITGTGIFTKGGVAILDSTQGGVNTGVIDTRDPSIPGSGNTINLSAGAGGPMNVSGALNAGPGQAILQGPSVTGLGSITSTSSNSVHVTAYAGNIGTDPALGGTALAITSPTVILSANGTLPANGNVYAALTGTTDLTLTAYNGFKVGSTTDLVTLNLNTYGNGAGPLVLTAPGQTYGFARNGNVFEIAGISGTRLTDFNLNVTRNTGVADGNVTVLGQMAVDNLDLRAQDTLKFDGSVSALSISNPSQTFYANQMVMQGNVTVAAGNYQYAFAYNTFDFTGKGTLSSGGSQSIYGQGGVTLQASGGTMNVTSAGAQTIANNYGGGSVTLLGGGANEKLNVTAAGSQSIYAYYSGDVTIQGGSGSDAAVTVSSTGSGSQSISSYNGNVFFRGGSADRASVTVSTTGSGSQSINSTYGSISMLGGNTAGTSDASVTVSSAGSQSISNYYYGNGDILLQAGDAHRASVLVSNSGSAAQTIAAGRSVTLKGGQGSNAAGGTDSIVSVTTAGNQSLQAATVGSGNLLMQGGSADGNSVSVRMTGSGTQSIVAGRNDDTGPSANVTLQGGNTVGTTGASVEIVGAGSSQRVYAQGAIAVKGGDGADAFAAIRSTSGTQDIGDALYHHDYYGSRNPTDSVVLSGGGGSNSYSLVQAAGRQYVEAQTDIGVQGGAGADAYARVTKTGAGEQRVGTVDYATLDFCSYYSCYYFRRQPLANVAVKGGAGAGALAKIDTDTVQRVSPTTSLTVQGFGDGAYGLITTTATDQYIGTSSYGNATTQIGATQIGAGAGAGAYAAIRSSGAQTIDVGNTTLAGGSGDASRVDITAAVSQYLSLGSLTMTGGSNRATDAFIKADNGQTIYAGTTSLTGGTGTSSGRASAYIFNDHGSQYLSVGNLTVRSGADYAAAYIQTLGTGQTLYAGAITLGTTAGTNTLGASYAIIEHLGTGAQTVSGNGISINNQHATGTVGIMSSGAQSITSNGAVSVQTGAAGDARVTANGAQDIIVTGALSVASSSGATALVKATGVQTIGTSGAVTVTASGSGTAAIDAMTGTQEIRGRSALPVNADPGQVASAYANSANGGVLVQATGAGGTARIENTAGGQTILGSYLYIDTAANGTALVKASGNQWVHTTGSGLRVRAMGGGSATLSSGGDQLLQIDYPELMRGAGSGSIIVGDVNAAGSSLIQAVNQDIFAKTISVVGGNVATADAKIDVSGVQNVSLVSSSSLMVGNVASVGSSLIDPVTQTILSNGAITVIGGSGTGAVGGIIGTGDQTILVTSGGASSISVAGGGGTDAFGQITTSGAIQRIGTSGGFVLTGGGGTNADAIIGANGGTAETFLACGTGFTCNAGSPPFAAIPSVNNPFVNGTTDVGVYYSPITVPLDDIIAATGGAVPESLTLEPPGFLFNSLILWAPELPLTDEERQEIVLGRRLPVCN